MPWWCFSLLKYSWTIAGVAYFRQFHATAQGDSDSFTRALKEQHTHGTHPGMHTCFQQCHSKCPSLEVFSSIESIRLCQLISMYRNCCEPIVLAKKMCMYVYIKLYIYTNLIDYRCKYTHIHVYIFIYTHVYVYYATCPYFLDIYA